MSQEYSEKFNVEMPAVVRIDNVNGSVSVRPGPDGEVSIHAVQHGKDDDRSRVEIGQNEDGSVFARSESRRSSIRFLNFTGESARVDFTVVVPPAANLKIRAVNSLAEVSGITGLVDLKTVNGTITVSEVSGELKFKTVNGEILGSRVSGSAEVTTVNGKITLKEADLPAMTAKSVSGDILLETPVGDGPYHLQTVSGNVQISTEGEMNGRIHYKTVGGSIRMNSQNLASNGHGRPGLSKKTIALGTGGPDIYFKSVSGDLAMEAESFVETEPDRSSVQMQPEPAGDFMDVLERIARGDLSVDEGIASLES